MEWERAGGKVDILGNERKREREKRWSVRVDEGECVNKWGRNHYQCLFLTHWANFREAKHLKQSRKLAEPKPLHILHKPPHTPAVLHGFVHPLSSRGRIFLVSSYNQ